MLRTFGPTLQGGINKACFPGDRHAIETLAKTGPQWLHGEMGAPFGVLALETIAKIHFWINRLSR